MVLERQEPDREIEVARTASGTYRHGDGASRILDIELRNREGPTRTLEPGAPVTIRVRARAERDLENPVVGVLIRNRLGIDVFGTNTRIEGVELGRICAGESFEVEFSFDCLLTRQDYTLTVATQYLEGFSQDWLDDAISFSVVDSRDVAGLANFKTKVEWRKETGVTL
jgi:hypothetical protein